jgi:transketolase
MRKQFVKTVEAILAEDAKSVLLLGDIGVWGFRKAFDDYPDRVYNIGILEQSTIGAAAGLSMSGFAPIVHTIAPFIVERATEQLKNDFCYQGLNGNFVSVGASYDYAALGATHHCPGDVAILKSMPGMEIILPGTSAEFDSLFRQGYSDGRPTYYRLTERENAESHEVSIGKAVVIREGSAATVIAVGPMLDRVLEASKDLDVTVLYYTSVAPFDREMLAANCPSGKILLCEPYYSGALAPDVVASFPGRSTQLELAGVPHGFLTNYGGAAEHDTGCGLTADDINKKLKALI